MPRTSVNTYRLGNSDETESDIEYANSTPDTVILDRERVTNHGTAHYREL